MLIFFSFYVFSHLWVLSILYSNSCDHTRFLSL